MYLSVKRSAKYYVKNRTTPTIEQLEKVLLKVFSYTNVPDVLVGGSSCDERKVATAIQRRSWQHLRLAHFLDKVDLSGILTFLTPEAGHYYLPALMLMCAKMPNESDVMLDAVLECLCTPVANSYPVYGQIVRRITVKEAQGVALFLRYMSDTYCEAITGYPIERALRYWEEKG